VNLPVDRRIVHRLRYAGLFLLVLLLLWLPVEDLHEGWVLGYGAALCAWGAARYLTTRKADPNRFWLHYLLVGAVAGTALTPAALLLMAFKTGLHGHEAPDFTSLQIARVITLTPAWILSGSFIGLGAGLWNTARSK
jgi:hypothetical protein